MPVIAEGPWTKVGVVVAILAVVIAIVGIVSAIPKNFKLEAQVGFQTGRNGDDYSSRIKLRNIGPTLRNMRGKIEPVPPQKAYFKPAPWQEKAFKSSVDDRHVLLMDWDIMNSGEEIDVPAIYHSSPIFSWRIWIKTDGATFSDVISCENCLGKTQATIVSTLGK